MLSLPERLKKWRASLNLTQQQAAEKIGVPYSTYCNWEIGHRSPRGLALRTVLGITAIDRAKQV